MWEILEITGTTLAISCSSTAIAALIFVPLGCLIYFNSFKGKMLLINIIQTFYSLPTVFVGLLVFMAFSKEGPLGFFGILFTPQVMVVGQVVLLAPIITGLTLSALKGVGPEIRDTAVSLGASRFQAVRIVLLEARHSTLNAVLVGFGRAISEVGLAVMVGGNIAGYTRTLATAIALETTEGAIGRPIVLGLILIAVALIVTYSVNRIQKRGRAS